MKKEKEDTMRFAARLRQERLWRHLSQEALAAAVGVSARSVTRWEQGQTVPQGSLRVELSRFFGLSPQELFGDEEPLVPLTPLWSVPYSRNPFFTGRDAFLSDLHTWLTSEPAIGFTQSLAITGLGGMGKTQVAIEYAYRYRQHYDAIFWLAAETAETLLMSFQQIADQIQLTERNAAEQSQMVAAVQRWLTANQQWLLIADNVEQVDVLQSILPPLGRGTLLLTTRHQALGAFTKLLELPPMSSEEGLTLLQRRARLQSTPSSDASSLQEVPQETVTLSGVVELVSFLEGFPLALDQAGAYIDETRCSIAEYVQRYSSHREKVLSRRGSYAGTHPASVTTTLRLSVEQVERKCPAAGDLLRLCAYLHAEAIPEELFREDRSLDGGSESTVVSDPYEFDLAVAALRGASLITRHPVTRTLSVHRLVQVVLQDQMEPAEARQWSMRVLRLVHAAFPNPTLESWDQCERCLAQALACVPLLERIEEGLPEAGELLYRAGSYLMERGRYREAEPLLEQALKLGEQLYGSDHTAYLDYLEIRAQLFWRQKAYKSAEPLLHCMLTHTEKHHGPEHPETAAVLNNLALLYWEQGAYKQAKPLYERALRIREQQLGPEHLSTANSLNNLAALYRDQGEYEQAKSLYERALRIREQQLGPEHPETAVIVGNLALLYWKQEEYEQAKPLYERALHIREQQLGPEHLDTANSLNNLATLYRDQGEYEQAKSLYERALRIREQQLGSEHLDTGVTLSHLARLYYLQSQMELSEQLYQRALSIYEQRLGFAHPQTTEIRSKYHQLFIQGENAAKKENV